MIQIETANEKIYMAGIEEIIEKAKIIIFDENAIEIENFLVVMKEIEEEGRGFDIARFTDSVWQRFVNITKTIVKSKESDFNRMLETLKTVEETENVFVLELPLKPKRTAIVNLRKLKNDLIFASEIKNKTGVLTKEPGETLMVNNVLFTTDAIEFHGSGMFTDKVAFLVSAEDLQKLKRYFLEDNTTQRG